MSLALSKSLPFSEAELDREHPTRSLLQLCSAYHLLTREKQMEYRQALDAAFFELSAQFTKRASSTIPRETAEALYDSLFFRCDAVLWRIAGVEQAIALLQATQPQVLMQRGELLITAALEETRTLFRQAYVLRLTKGTIEYDFVMEQTYEQFRTSYQPRFFPRRTNAVYDYPLLTGPAYALEEQGVFTMHSYYSALLLENQFLAEFPEPQIQQVLADAGAFCRCPPRELMENIATLVFQRAMCNLMTGKTESLLSRPVLTKIPCTAADGCCQAAFSRLTQNTPPDRKSYLAKHLPQFQSALAFALKNGTGAQLFYLRE